MNATATKGVWSDQLTPKLTMICDTVRNRIRIVNIEENKPAMNYDFPDGIKTSDVERIRKSTLKSLGIRD
jgi:hypothetical protein